MHLTLKYEKWLNNDFVILLCTECLAVTFEFAHKVCIGELQKSYNRASVKL